MASMQTGDISITLLAHLAQIVHTIRHSVVPGEKIILKILFGYRPHHNPELDRTASEVEALTRLDRCSTETNRVPVTPAKFLEKILRRRAVGGWNI